MTRFRKGGGYTSNEIDILQDLSWNYVQASNLGGRGGEYGHDWVVKLLLDTGTVDCYTEDECSRTPLSWAASNGHETVFRQLLNTGRVDINSKCRVERTVLSWAAMNGHEAVVKQLLEVEKAEPDSKAEYAEMALSLAASGGHETMVKQFGRRLTSIDCDFQTSHCLS